MVRLKKGQRYLRTYKDGLGPTLLLEIERDSSGDSAPAKIIQRFDLNKTPLHRDWEGLLTWAFLYPAPDITYTYLPGQDAP